jgi:hypothetical protein
LERVGELIDRRFEMVRHVATAFLNGALWHDPRQPRRLLVPTGWSGPFACSCTRAVRLRDSQPSFRRAMGSPAPVT